jgi:adenylylsulfate kinase
MGRGVVPVNGAVVWFTGLPSSGKSTLARAVQERLAAAGRSAALLDGDEVRDAMVPRPGYSAAEREAFYASLARLAALLARQGLVVLVAATAHRRVFREEARGLAPRFAEVFLDVPEEACRARDAKGLYAKAAAGDAASLPGAGIAYERPLAPDVLARGGEDAAAVEAVLAWVQKTSPAPR